MSAPHGYKDRPLQGPDHALGPESAHGPARMANPQRFGGEGREQNDLSLDQQERHLETEDRFDSVAEARTSVPIEKDFTVTWDGEDDPKSPRSLTKARKWLIVMIIATSSFCV